MKPFRWPLLVGFLLAAVLAHAVPQMLHVGSRSEMAALSCTDCGGAAAAGAADCATQCLKASDDTRHALLPRPDVGSGVVLTMLLCAAVLSFRTQKTINESAPVSIGPRLIAGLTMRE